MIDYFMSLTSVCDDFNDDKVKSESQVVFVFSLLNALGNACTQVRSTGEEGAVSIRIKSWKYLSVNRNVSLILHIRK